MDKCSECDGEPNHSGLCNKHYLEMVGGSAHEYKIQSLTDQIKAIPFDKLVELVYSFAKDSEELRNEINRINSQQC